MAECQIPWIGIDIGFHRQKSNQESTWSCSACIKHVKGAKAEPESQLRQPEGPAGYHMNTWSVPKKFQRQQGDRTKYLCQI